MPVSVANSQVIYDALKACDVKIISALPETWLVHLIRMADDDPETILVCHCTDCQVMSGGPYRNNAPCKGENFKLTKGTPSLYLKTADSGNKRNQAFCGNCGAGIYSAVAEENPGMYILRVGAIRQRDQLVDGAEDQHEPAEPDPCRGER